MFRKHRCCDFGEVLTFGFCFTYRKTSDGWKICATGYQRTYEVAQKLDGKLTQGPALA
jgi:hypothetical protein